MRDPPPLALLAPSVAFPVTVCVLCYGGHTALARRFLTSLYRHTDPALFTLRAGLNEISAGTLELFRGFAAEKGNIELQTAERNIFKSPMMRRLFTEPPLTSKWVIWFDDDSFITRDDWLFRLALKMESSPGAVQWGKPYYLWSRDKTVPEFIRRASWHRGLPLVRGKDAVGRPAWEFRFITGGFWALRSDIIRLLDWPDPRLRQAHDDFLLGEALRQNNLAVGAFEYGVEIDDAPRRNGAADEVKCLPDQREK